MLAVVHAPLYAFGVPDRKIHCVSRRAVQRWTSATLATVLAAALAASVAGPVSASAGVSSAGVSSAGGPGARELAAARSVRLGSVALRRCARAPLTFCGHLAVPLDYASAASPRIRIGFRWLPATRRAAGTVLSVEGGPGFATTGSEGNYLSDIGPLHQARSLLVIDLRGTGTSTPIDCRGLERAGQHQSGRRFDRLVGACGAQLDHQWRYRGGGWVHASEDFNTAYSARDIARVLRALRLGRVDLYGDSYGIWFAQTFASRYRAVHLLDRYALGLPAVGRVRGRHPRVRVGPDRRAGRPTGPGTSHRADHHRRRHQGSPDSDCRDAGQPRE